MKHSEKFICLGLHRQTCLVTFNPTCLSRLLATKGLPVLCLLTVNNANGTRLNASDDDWDEILLMD
jgi:hypothetical protein